MAKAKNGDTVRVHYTGKLEDGTVFDSSTGRPPLEFKLGEGEVIEGFDKAIAGMETGESKTANIPFDKAYGPYHEEMVVEIRRNVFPESAPPQIGQILQLRSPKGQQMQVTVTSITDDKVSLDANHPLAGKNLVFDIQLVEII